MYLDSGGLHDLAVPQGRKSYRLPGPGVMNAGTETSILGGNTIPHRGRSHTSGVGTRKGVCTLSGELSRCKPVRRDMFRNCTWHCETGASNSQSRIMAGPKGKLIAAVEEYFGTVRQVRASGGGTEDRSCYPAVGGLLRKLGQMLKPKVYCVLEAADQGVGHPDSSLPSTRRIRSRGAAPRADRCRSVASSR